MSKSRHAVAEPACDVAPGIAIYRTHASPYWFARIRTHGRYVVRSTKEEGKVAAKKAALELGRDMVFKSPPATPPEYLFKTYAHRFMTIMRSKASRRELNDNYVRTLASCLDNEEWGLLKVFGEKYVRSLTTQVFADYMETLALSASTRKSIKVLIRSILKLAVQAGVIVAAPELPVIKREDNARPPLWFEPLGQPCEYQALLTRVQEAAMDGEFATHQSGARYYITHELADLITFTTASFVRPIRTELFALRHRFISIATNPDHLIVSIPTHSKTKGRQAVTLAKAVSAYLRQRERYSNWKPDDYVWFPQYENRQTALKAVSEQFNYILKNAKLKTCPRTELERSLYSLRHTSICRALYDQSTDIRSLAKNAGTSVDMIERFYTKYLPVSRQQIMNIQGDTTEKDKGEADWGNLPWPDKLGTAFGNAFLRAEHQGFKERFYEEWRALPKPEAWNDANLKAWLEGIERFIHEEPWRKSH
jgi:hypothetical protein